MNNIIPKNLFMIWLGDTIPNYVQFSINAYKQANANFNIQLVHHTLKQIEDIYNNKLTNIYDNLLNEVMFNILNKDKTYMLDHQKDFYGKEIRFIQLLSDIYRLRIIQEFGGIYVDCDTFPLKPFDEKLLQLKIFMVTRHYNNDRHYNDNANYYIGNDNYFFGSIKDANINEQQKLLQTNDKWWSNIQYLINKNKFYGLKLNYIEQQNQPIYIEHYFDGNWKNKNGKIRTPKCFLDKLYKT